MLLVCILLLPMYVSAQESEEVAGYESAVAEYKKGDWNATIEEIRKLHDAGGNTYESHALCAYAYNQLGNFESSSAHFFAAIKLKPDDPRLRADVIRLYLNHNKTKGALELSTAYVEKFPEDLELDILYATSLFLRGNPKTALGRVESLKTKSPDNPEILNLEGKIYFKMEKFEKADVSLRWASAIQKESPSIWNNLALVQEKLFLQYKNSNSQLANDYLKEAKESIQKAISLDAKDDSISQNAERILSHASF